MLDSCQLYHAVLSPVGSTWLFLEAAWLAHQSQWRTIQPLEKAKTRQSDTIFYQYYFIIVIGKHHSRWILTSWALTACHGLYWVNHFTAFIYRAVHSVRGYTWTYKAYPNGARDVILHVICIKLPYVCKFWEIYSNRPQDVNGNRKRFQWLQSIPLCTLNSNNGLSCIWLSSCSLFR